MRNLSTDAERDEAVALVQDRQRWLSQRGLPLTARADVPALFRDPQAAPAGLFEDGLLLACMIPQRSPALGWGRGPCLFLDCLHTLPDQLEDSLRLITLWASDFATRLDLPLVRAEAATTAFHGTDPTSPFLRRITDMGWDIRGSATVRQQEHVTRLELPAEQRPSLGALIGCRVQEPRSTADTRSAK
ncbi:hypothetical protein [Streptomyces sp. CFMR 7]|uniref:hypothetical protein n=1 Tax=Streptomyces sp. CFMR 7 TaxID=1649184 RepID=UPI0028D6CED8|nr:hypothetical protein [Streptomyces sp. CFMR 7]